MHSLGSPLLTAVRGQIVCDGGTVVSGIVDFVVSRRRSLRLLSHLIERSAAAATALIVVNALRCFAGVRCPPGGGALVVARRPNERREVDALRAILPDIAWTQVAFEWRPASMLAAFRTISRPLADLQRTARLSRRLVRRFGVFRALRSVELIACYRRYVRLLDRGRFTLAVMSSHSNPHGIALNAAAHRFGIPVVLMTHGMPVRPMARLDYELAIHECEASRRVYLEAGCRMNHTVIKSRRSEYRALPRRWPEGWSRVAICLSKDPVSDKVMACVRALLADSSTQQVLIRPHPVNLWDGLAEAVASLGDERVTMRASTRLSDDLRACDLVLGGNSTVLLDALVAGTPACYVRGLDHGPHDVQDFVRDGLVYEGPHLPPVDARAVARFYSRREWPAILRRYAAVDLSPDDVRRAVRSAVGRSAGRQVGWLPDRRPADRRPTDCQERRMNIVAIIPARMGSSRFPGKPLAQLHGVPMLGHVYFRTRLNPRLSGVYIATCDDEIGAYAGSIGASCIMTSSAHTRASDRTAEAAAIIDRTSGPIDAVVMVQGDEPMLVPSMIDEAILPLAGDPTVQVVNLMAPIGPDDAADPNEVKVGVDRRSNALYFSRHPLPWQNGSISTPMFKQVCVIPFRRAFLSLFAALEPTPLEQAESIDMLRALEHGYAVRMARTAHVTLSVDTPADLDRVSRLMEKKALQEIRRSRAGFVS